MRKNTGSGDLEDEFIIISNFSRSYWKMRKGRYHRAHETVFSLWTFSRFPSREHMPSKNGFSR